MSDLFDAISLYARGRNAVLNPAWLSVVEKYKDNEVHDAINQVSIELGWQICRRDDLPRVSEFPLLAYHVDHGWVVVEKLVLASVVRLISSRGTFDVEVSPALQLWSVQFPGETKIQGALRASGVFWSAVMRRKSMLVDAAVATVVVNLIAIVTSIYSMQVYDRVIPREGFDTLFVLTFGAFIALLFDSLIRFARSMILDRESAHIDSEVSEYFFSRMHAVRLDARPRSVGTMAAQLRGTDQVRALMSSASLFLLADLPFAVFFIIVMAWLGGVISFVPILAFSIALLLAVLMGRLIKRDTEVALVSGNKKNGQLVEALDAAETIKANLGSWYMLTRWNRLGDEVLSSDLRIKRWSTLSATCFSFIQQISYVSVVFFGVFQVSIGEMTMGAVIACSILSGRVNGPLVASLPNLIVQWSFAKCSLAALDSILVLPTDQREPSEMLRMPRLSGPIELEGVSFTYGGARPSLLVPKLKFCGGERVGVIGSVGSGKSTLLRLMAGLYAPSEGVVSVNGVDIGQVFEEDIRSQICYFPQDFRLITGSLRDNLTLGVSGKSDEEILEACQKSGLDGVIRRHPAGLDLPVYEGGTGLSGGQRFLVGLTRILLLKPVFLLLDEPTGNLDQNSELRALHAIFSSVTPLCSIVLVTHKPQLLSLVQRLIVLRDGKVVLDGPTASVIEKLSADVSGRSRIK